MNSQSGQTTHMENLVKSCPQEGKELDCPGMTLKFNDGQAITDMMPCLGKATEDFPVKFRNNHGAMTPAGVDMFEEDQLTKLDEEFKGIFHGVTLSFGSERARPDTQPIVALLCVRVK